MTYSGWLMGNAAVLSGPCLAIDSSSSLAFCGIESAAGRIIEEVSGDATSHNEELSLRISSLLSTAGLVPSKLKAVCIGSGPGSFTGLRIGYSVAKGLCCALRIPLIEICSHHAIAIGADLQSGSVVVLGDARRDELFCSAYRFSGPGSSGEEILRPHIIAVAEIPRLLRQFPADEPVRIVSELPSIEGVSAPIEHPRRVGYGLLMAAKTVSYQLFNEDFIAQQTPTYLRAVAAKTIAERQGA